MSLKDELPLWREVSDKLDRLYSERKPEKPGLTCPFCGRTSVLIEMTETMNGPGKGLKIGFFTCRSCDESWSGLVK